MKVTYFNKQWDVVSISPYKLYTLKRGLRTVKNIPEYFITRPTPMDQLKFETICNYEIQA